MIIAKDCQLVVPAKLQVCTGEKGIPGALGDVVVRLGPQEAVEGGGGGDRVGSHVVKVEPVTLVKLRQGHVTDLV